MISKCGTSHSASVLYRWNPPPNWSRMPPAAMASSACRTCPMRASFGSGPVDRQQQLQQRLPRELRRRPEAAVPPVVVGRRPLDQPPHERAVDRDRRRRRRRLRQLPHGFRSDRRPTSPPPPGGSGTRRPTPAAATRTPAARRSRPPGSTSPRRTAAGPAVSHTLIGHPPRRVSSCTAVMYVWSTSGRSSRSTLMQTNPSFITAATASFSKLSRSITWHQ